MIDVAPKNYHSGKLASKANTRKAFITTLLFIFGGLSIFVADHVGQTLQHERVVEVASR
ncbi:hypothetical protein [Paraburkholderia sp. HD33-4]|uniref:hypothetical protein n=1 Tax=Paraburkholderia sp. HD33-4 TaxID=2883242 RepID=UPI001F18C9C7|nr:hypothetical protein [Paraburkholderia sp. HD33-4]